MKNSVYIIKLNSGLSKEQTGNKAASLQFLRQNRFKIPETWVVKTEAYENFRKHQMEVIQKLKEELKQLPDYQFAVRSSTNFEDAENYSHAGQFQTYINVKGVDDILLAVEKVWESAGKYHPEYKNAPLNEELQLKCAVIVQKMVEPVLAGVSFSKNPVNNRNEIIVEAVEGHGEELVQKGVTPLRWKIQRNRITEECNKPEWSKTVLKVAQATEKLRKKYGRHVDIEWAYDGHRIYYLQLRSITADTEELVYSCKMVKEMLPGQIKPLVWSVNIPLVIGSKIDIINRLAGKERVYPDDLSKAFYYRIYFNVRALGRILDEFGVPLESLEATMLDENQTKHSFKPGIRTLKHTFRIIGFIRYILRFESFFVKEFGELEQIFPGISDRITNDFSVENYPVLYKSICEEGRRLTHLNIIIPLLMRVYNKRFSKKLKKAGFDYEKIDFSAHFPELEQYSPLPWMQSIKRQFEDLPEGVRGQCISFAAVKTVPEAGQIVAAVDRFLKKFGHFSESGNDFSYTKWAEDQEFVYTMILDTLLPGESHKLSRFEELGLKKREYTKLKKSFEKAGRFKLYREQISSLFIYGFGLFRKLFLKLGDELVSLNILNENGDIFYLYKNEIDAVIAEGEAVAGYYRTLVNLRKKEMEESKDLILPTIIYGDVAPVSDFGNTKSFKGVGTSPGTYSGKTRVVKAVADFPKVTKGDVVIIPFSDVSWTPVLAKAGAIISESGGMLSHCSIIARELGIPALVSIDNACSLDDGLQVTVNGSNGMLAVHDFET